MRDRFARVAAGREDCPRPCDPACCRRSAWPAACRWSVVCRRAGLAAFLACSLSDFSAGALAAGLLAALARGRAPALLGGAAGGMVGLHLVALAGARVAVRPFDWPGSRRRPTGCGCRRCRRLSSARVGRRPSRRRRGDRRRSRPCESDCLLPAVGESGDVRPCRRSPLGRVFRLLIGDPSLSPCGVGRTGQPDRCPVPGPGGCCCWRSSPPFRGRVILGLLRACGRSRRLTRLIGVGAVAAGLPQRASVWPPLGRGPGAGTPRCPGCG